MFFFHCIISVATRGRQVEKKINVLFEMGSSVAEVYLT